jgi:hypothetical protein
MMMGGFGFGQSTNKNTEAGDTEGNEDQAARLKNMLNNNLINVPGLNPTKKNKFQDDTPVNTQADEQID